MKTYILPESLHADLLAYLMSRPYSEVAAGVAKLSALAEIPPPAEPTAEHDPATVVFPGPKKR